MAASASLLTGDCFILMVMWPLMDTPSTVAPRSCMKRLVSMMGIPTPMRMISVSNPLILPPRNSVNLEINSEKSGIALTRSRAAKVGKEGWEALSLVVWR